MFFVSCVVELAAHPGGPCQYGITALFIHVTHLHTAARLAHARRVVFPSPASWLRLN